MLKKSAENSKLYNTCTTTNKTASSDKNFSKRKHYVKQKDSPQMIIRILINIFLGIERKEMFSGKNYL